MPFYQYEHIPGIDYLGRDLTSDIAPRQLGSVCAQLGKKQALSEMFACCGWDVSPNELKRIAELQYVNGVNMMCQHLYPYSIRGQRKTDYPCHYSEHLPWQQALGEFNTYFNHLGYTLSRGEEQASVLVIHPMHAAYLVYKRAQDIDSVYELQEDFFALNRLLSEHQVPYHFGDEWMMADMASVEGSKIRVGRCVYDHVVIPAMDTLDNTTAALLKKYLAAGGRLFLFGKAPTRINGRKADLSWLKGNCGFQELRATSDIRIAKDWHNVPQLRQMTRKTPAGRLTFITNLSGDTLRDVRVSMRGARQLRALDMNSLVLREVPTECGADGCTARLTFEDSEAYVLVETEEPVEGRVCAPDAAIALKNDFRLTERPDNMMTLDYAEISYDGVTYEKARPIILIKDLLLRARYKGDLYLKFSFDVAELPETLRLAAEPLKYYSVTLNGAPLSLSGDWWLDRSFKTADIAAFVRSGRNELVMKIDYFQRDYVYYVLYGGVSESLRNCLNFDTEIESVYLVGKFCVETDSAHMHAEEKSAICYDGSFRLTRQKDKIDLSNIVSDGYPFFGGAIEAETTYLYEAGGATELFVNGRYAVCEVRVNGEYAGRLMFKRHINLAAFLKPGENTIALKLYNANRNLLGPHHYKEAEPYGVGPSTFSLENRWNGEECPAFRSRYAFVRFGIDF